MSSIYISSHSLYQHCKDNSRIASANTLTDCRCGLYAAYSVAEEGFDINSINWIGDGSGSWSFKTPLQGVENKLEMLLREEYHRRRRRGNYLMCSALYEKLLAPLRVEALGSL
ncbi:hypothetical protein ACTFIW_000923 [Dictyostelium discoideum]